MSGPCAHDWSELYVCSRCGSIKYASAPLWATMAKIPSGPRGPWLALWSFADRDTVAPDPVYPSNAAIAERCGRVTERTVQRGLEALALAGWIMIDASSGVRLISLAWGAPRDDWREAAGRTPGHVYAVLFTNGHVKVGRSANAGARVEDHRASAARFGLGVLRAEVKAVSDMMSSEAILIRALTDACAPVHGSEWFSSGFDLALSIMEGLS